MEPSNDELFNRINACLDGNTPSTLEETIERLFFKIWSGHDVAKFIFREAEQKKRERFEEIKGIVQLLKIPGLPQEKRDSLVTRLKDIQNG